MSPAKPGEPTQSLKPCFVVSHDNWRACSSGNSSSESADDDAPDTQPTEVAPCQNLRVTKREHGGRHPEIHAHRGASVQYPENTMAAFSAARELGADAIEFDVHATADGHLVVLHDYDLARTTSGTGLVHECELAYVRSLSAGAWFGDDFADAQVPLLAEVLEMQDVDFELEVKGLPTPALISGVVDAVRQAGVAERVELTGYHYVALMQLGQQLPESRLGLFPQRFAPWMTGHLYEQIVSQTALCGSFDVVHVPAPLLPKVDVERLHAVGLQLHAADPTTTEELIAALGQADQLTTDDPEAALRLRSDTC
jgi:glycerophosphoryl diester phosphodiesterase